jgi:hypothetical protein
MKHNRYELPAVQQGHGSHHRFCNSSTRLENPWQLCQGRDRLRLASLMPFGQKKEVMEKIVLEERGMTVEKSSAQPSVASVSRISCGMSPGRALRAPELDYQLPRECQKEWHAI